jgi:hypothetical protein
MVSRTEVPRARLRRAGGRAVALPHVGQVGHGEAPHVPEEPDVLVPLGPAALELDVPRASAREPEIPFITDSHAAMACGVVRISWSATRSTFIHARVHASHRRSVGGGDVGLGCRSPSGNHRMFQVATRTAFGRVPVMRRPAKTTASHRSAEAQTCEASLAWSTGGGSTGGVTGGKTWRT